MTDAVWRGSTLLATLRAGDLISALTRVSSARSQHPDSPLSGTMLYFPGGDEALVWAGDGSRFAMTRLTAKGALSETRMLSLPAGFAGSIRTHLERSDEIELGAAADGAALVRRPGEQLTIVQPLWPAERHVELYNAFIIEGSSDGALCVRGSEVLARLRHTSIPPTVTVSVSSDSVRIGAAHEAWSEAVPATVSARPENLLCRTVLLTDAADAVVNVKFPDLNIECFSAEGVLRLYGSSRSDPPRFGDLDYFIRTGPQRDHDRVALLASPRDAPGEATLAVPATVEPIDEVLAELDAIIGQPELKRQVRGLLNQVEINRRRTEQGLKASQMANHMVFSGPPGTGKTTVARLIARLYNTLGVLENTDVSEVARPDLVSPNIGGTEEKTAKVIADAMGGVLFIDELRDGKYTS